MKSGLEWLWHHGATMNTEYSKSNIHHSVFCVNSGFACGAEPLLLSTPSCSVTTLLLSHFPFPLFTPEAHADESVASGTPASRKWPAAAPLTFGWPDASLVWECMPPWKLVVFCPTEPWRDGSLARQGFFYKTLQELDRNWLWPYLTNVTFHLMNSCHAINSMFMKI